MNIDFKKNLIVILIISIIVSSLVGAIMGFWAGTVASSGFQPFNWFEQVVMGHEYTQKVDDVYAEKKIIRVEEESAVVEVVEKTSPAVVSIIITKDLPVIERFNYDSFGGFFEEFFGEDFSDFFGMESPSYKQRGTERTEVGGGTGFLVSSDGYIITNRHVVVDEEADYTVLMNDESKYEAEVLARDPINDLAILKMKGVDLPYIELGDSSALKVGQGVIAIGNSLGEFRNTVSTGVVSGLSRSVTAGSFGFGTEQLMGVIQTDASINPGNSGGPLLNLAGQAIGINTAMAVGAENIGFAIPINEVKNIYESVREHGRILRPWLGVRYVQVNELIAEQNKLDIDYGALVIRGDTRTELAVIPGSPADKAGLVENDIILEINKEQINNDNPLAKAISKFKPGDEIELKVLHRGEEENIKVKLEEME